MTVRMRLMELMAAAALLMALLGAAFCSAEDLPATAEIVANVNARNEGEHVTRNLSMEMIEKDGKSRVRETFGYRRYFGDEKRTVIFYLSPSNIKDTAFLTYDYPEASRDDDQWLYLPATRKTRRISASDRGDYFLGTDFTYEDIKKEGKFSLEDFTYETIGEDVVDGHRCVEIESVPVDEATAKELGYGKVRAWVDVEIWMVRKSEFWDIRQNPLKTILIQDIENLDGIWTVGKMRAENHKTGHTTIFTFSKIDYNSPVEEDVFTERAMIRGL